MSYAAGSRLSRKHADEQRLVRFSPPLCLIPVQPHHAWCPGSALALHSLLLVAKRCLGTPESGCVPPLLRIFHGSHFIQDKSQVLTVAHKALHNLPLSPPCPLIFPSSHSSCHFLNVSLNTGTQLHLCMCCSPSQGGGHHHLSPAEEESEALRGRVTRPVSPSESVSDV